MPGTRSYPAAYVQACRDEIAAQIRAYRDLVAAASKASGMSLTRIDAALSAFEPAFFNNLLIALEMRFVHRLRDTEGQDGNPLNEVRMLAASLMANDGVLAANTTIAYDPSKAVLRIDIGERIRLNADDFETLCALFLHEIERQFA
ncbi:MAG: hypothetical protein ABIR54_00410 [Burkholderiaceae bacterium]